ncbi:hypothetical protein [Halococcus saccharolyticus]|uniref:Uncharacterized protein n=1 Tax=Halococcus saccharolyticus DSM 5350 TaxID=1227455 RepID=M0MBJ6_9EURY|nr:hypothetical protein C449_14097 [Halococcus saccharolyticus DSM 5350]
MTHFDEVRPGEQYQSTTTPDEEVLEVVAKRDDEIIFEAIDSGRVLDRISRSEWDPDRWIPASTRMV